MVSGSNDFGGAVFDGRYLYVEPGNNSAVFRFDAKTPASMPKLPAFSGSFYQTSVMAMPARPAAASP